MYDSDKFPFDLVKGYENGLLISQLIDKLKKVKEEEGDIKVVINCNGKKGGVNEIASAVLLAGYPDKDLLGKEQLSFPRQLMLLPHDDDWESLKESVNKSIVK